MGAYSEMDAELRYDGAAFVDDDDEDQSCLAAVPDENEDAGVPASEDDDGLKDETEPVPAPQSAPERDVKDQTTAQAAAAKSTADEDAKRKAHEEAEAKRKAEWEAAQKKKKADELLQLAKLDAMSDEEVLTASTQRVSTDTEKLTRRNMMECVMEHIQTMCLDDPTFARKVMHPRKNMIRCYQYINRKAWEYVQDEMKAKGITPGRDTPSYASAIPEGVCYQWAVDYFNDPDAKEDHEEEEKFVPKPYPGTTITAAKKSKDKGKTASKGKAEKGSASKEARPAAPKPKDKDDGGQISLGGFTMPKEKAG